jgi:hypothetical protein
MAPKKPTSQEPDLPYERALPALRQQLAKLQNLKGRRYDDADMEETGWKNLTESIIGRTFGVPSPNLTKFFGARSAGQHYLGGLSAGQLQSNFDQRIREFDVLLQSLVAEIELFSPEVEIKGSYEPGEEYAVYRDLSTIVADAVKEVLIVDAYLDETIFNLYVDKIIPSVKVRILSNKIGSNVEAVARMFASGRSLELSSSTAIHDRLLFVDDRGWVIGQSIKDAARTKPTYLIELQEPALSALRAAHESSWSSSRRIT